MTFLEKWIEYDYNPFIIFDSSGKVLSLNSEAQYLLGKTSNKVIFDLAIDYATESFGFNTFFLDISFDKFDFFAITVGYESENEIGIKLYKRANKRIKIRDKKDSTLSNIYVLVDLSISTFSTKNNIEFIKDFDPAIPDIYANVDMVLKLLNKIYNSFIESKKIKSKIFVNIGEHIKIENKKFPILRIEISGDCFDDSKKSDIEHLSALSESTIYFQKNMVTLDMPIITTS